MRTSRTAAIAVIRSYCGLLIDIVALNYVMVPMTWLIGLVAMIVGSSVTLHLTVDNWLVILPRSMLMAFLLYSLSLAAYRAIVRNSTASTICHWSRLSLRRLLMCFACSALGVSIYCTFPPSRFPSFSESVSFEVMRRIGGLCMAVVMVWSRRTFDQRGAGQVRGERAL